MSKMSHEIRWSIWKSKSIFWIQEIAELCSMWKNNIQIKILSRVRSDSEKRMVERIQQASGQSGLCEELPVEQEKERPECLRCGKCCYWFIKTIEDQNGNKIDIFTYCDHLKKETGGRNGKRTYCDIYAKRIGTEIVPGYKCSHRFESPYDYPGCPYNTGKPTHPAFKEPDLNA